MAHLLLRHLQGRFESSERDSSSSLNIVIEDGVSIVVTIQNPLRVRRSWERKSRRVRFGSRRLREIIRESELTEIFEVKKSSLPKLLLA